MLERLRNRWIQLIVVAVVIGGVVGAVGGQFVLPEGDIEQVATALGDRVLVFSPLETGEATGGRFNYGSASDATKDAVKADLPLTAAAAVADGWADPVLCEVGRGRTFRKAGKQDVPLPADLQRRRGAAGDVPV